MSADPSFSEREVLVKAVLRLFDEWNVPEAERISILGPGQESSVSLRELLVQTDSENPDLFDRIGYLLRIYRMLGELYPANPEIRSTWFKSKNRRFGGEAPADIATRYGFPGLQMIQAELIRRSES